MKIHDLTITSTPHKALSSKTSSLVDQTKVIPRKLPILLFSALVFLGALLSFSMQPLVGRIVLPLFGGAVHVWLTCMMLFQGMLLLGYAYAHFFSRRLGAWHLVILLLPFINIPFVTNLAPLSSNHPQLSLIILLLMNFALPFSVLSSTATVAQVWFSRSSISKFGEPYFLYASSNAGSLIGLLSYPLIVEPFVGLRAQSMFWAIGFGLYLALISCVWLIVRPHDGPDPSPTRESSVLEGEQPRSRDYALWLLLSGIPSAFLLAVTNMVTLEIGSFSLVWIAPLSLYLSSFIITFRSKSTAVSRASRHIWIEVMVFGLLIYLLPPIHWGFILGHLLALAALCLLAHRELYERRPPVRYLTHFYLTIAIGGWLGGILVSLISPVAFSGLYEYPLVLIVFGIIFWRLHFAVFNHFWRDAHIFIGGIRLMALSLMILLIGIGVKTSLDNDEQFRHRNLYGIYKIYDTRVSKSNQDRIRKLAHGSTLHGSQMLAPDQQDIPTSYYHFEGNIAKAFEIILSPRRIGVIGLGTGATAMYARLGDTVTYYEIDPDNERIAQKWFTYLEKSIGTIEVIVGDGRLSLQKSSLGELKHDIILVDAFTGDGIPVHLLTVEAVKLYAEHVTHRGIIIFHISNRYYDLGPLIKSIAETLKIGGVISPPLVTDMANEWATDSQVIVLAKDPTVLSHLVEGNWIAFNGADALAKATPWTDDYINMLAPLISKMKK